MPRWPWSARAPPVPLDEIDVVEVRVWWRVLFALFVVRVIDARGRTHVVTGPWFGRARAEAIARALEEAAGLEAIPDDEWLRAARAVTEAKHSA